MRFTQDISAQIYKLNEALINADAVVIGAGAGLSTAAGFEYSGERFKKYFSDFAKKYGFEDMYSGGFYPYETPEEFWAYWSRYIFVNRYSDPPKNVYQKLLKIVKGKDYFVITTNVDHCFQKAGFDKERLFYTQGDYGLFQCSVPCHNKTYDNKETVRHMVSEQKDMRVPSELIPRCPVCGSPMTMNLRSDAACEHYKRFINTKSQNKVLFLELGVGFNTPGIIKYPFMRMTAQNKNATYVCINRGEAICPKQISDRTIAIDADICDVIFSLGQADGK